MNIILFLLLSGCTKEGMNTNSIFPTLRMWVKRDRAGAKGLNNVLKLFNEE